MQLQLLAQGSDLSLRCLAGAGDLGGLAGLRSAADLVARTSRSRTARTQAESRLRLASPPQTQLGHDELVTMIRTMGDMVKVLADADRSRKAKVYSGLGLRLTYYATERRVLIGQASGRGPIGERFVSEGGLEPFAYLLQSPDDAWLDLRGSA